MNADVNADVIEELHEPCPSCGVSGWVWICPATQRVGCQACGECTHILVDSGEGVSCG